MSIWTIAAGFFARLAGHPAVGEATAANAAIGPLKLVARRGELWLC